MAFNGSGTFSLVAGNPVVTGTTISSTTHNNTLTDIATGLSTCLTKNGQTTVTANIPLAGYKLTGLGAATANGDAVRFQQTLVGLASAKGASLFATAANAVAEKAAPADGYIRMADSAQADGWRDVPYMQKNAIINGDFNIWQRGTSFAAAAAGSYSADRWRYNKSGAAVHTVAQSSLVPTVAEASRLFNYSLWLDCTTADAAIAAGDFTIIGQRIEGYNWLALAQRQVTLSFWVRATKTGTYCAYMTNDVDRSCVKEFTINAADTWEKKALTFAASPSAGTWDYTSGTGVHVGIALAAGTTYQAPAADAWQTGLYFATANQVNGTDNVANDFRIAGVQLELGSVATEFERRSYQQELALCLRYFRFLTGLMVRQNWAATGATQAAYSTYSLNAAMRATPTATINNNGTNVGNANNPTVSDVSVDAFTLAVGATAGGSAFVRTDIQVFLSAEL